MCAVMVIQKMNFYYLFFTLWSLLLIAVLSHGLENFHFTQTPQNQSVQIGGRVVLKCAANLKPSIKQWRSNDGTILGEHPAGVLPHNRPRYKYVYDTENQLDLQIDNISLSDDGMFECQMLSNATKRRIRIKAYVDVLVAPNEVFFQYRGFGNNMEMEAGEPIDIKCISPVSKPKPHVSLFLNGKRIKDSVTTERKHHNMTIETTTLTRFTPSSNDNEKILACEVVHEQTNTTIREFIKLSVLYPSDVPIIEVLGSSQNFDHNGFKVGDNVTMHCFVEGGNPPPTLVWSDQGGLINSTLNSYKYDLESKTTTNEYSFIVRSEDNGNKYVCSSWNQVDASQLQSSLSVDVRYSPVKVFIIGQTAVRKGDELKISCRSSVSNPAATLTWKINNNFLSAQPQVTRIHSHGVVAESNITINIGSDVDIANNQNQISVECFAENGQGPTVSSTHIARILLPPSNPFIHAANEHIEFREGELMNLTCQANGGNPLAQLYWYRGGLDKKSSKYNYPHHKTRTRWREITEVHNTNSQDFSSSIIFIRVDRTMNGNRFRCEAESPAMDIPLNVEVTLSVQFPPDRLDVMQIESEYDEGMLAGHISKLSCLTSPSNPTPIIHWEFSSKNKNEGTIEKSGLYTKKPTKPNGEHLGYKIENIIQFTPNETMNGVVVRCVASSANWGKLVYSNNYTLNVLYGPRTLINDSINLQVQEGESFEEKIFVFSNPPIDFFQWKKNGITFDRLVGELYDTSMGSIYVQGPNPIVISGISVEKDDAGDYALKLLNRVGATNITVKLSVAYGARITYITTPVYANVGEDIALECEADGNPLKVNMLKWMRDDTEIRSVSFYEHKRAILRLRASHENSGVYKCVADNGIGVANFSNALLLVRHAPGIVNLPSIKRSAGPLGGKASLRCRVKAVPTAEFSWAIEGDGKIIIHNTTKYQFYTTKLDPSTFQSTLTVLNLEDQDYRKKFYCRAHNRIGSADTTFRIELPTNPDVPSDIMVINATTSTAELTWMAGFDGGFDDQIFEVVYWGTDENIESANTTKSRIILRGLKNQRYFVKIRSRNKRYTSQFSEPIEFFTSNDSQVVFKATMKTNNSWLTHPIFLWASTILLFMFFIHCMVILCLRRRKRLHSENYRSSLNPRNGKNNNNKENGRNNIQIYGTMSTNKAASARPHSNITSKSEDVACTSEDNDDIQTVIELSPPYYQVANVNNSYYNNTTRLATEFDGNGDIYARIQQKLPYGDATYFAHHNPVPPNIDELSSYQDYSTQPMTIYPHSPMIHRGLDGLECSPREDLVLLNNVDDAGGVYLGQSQYAQYYYVHDSLNPEAQQVLQVQPHLLNGYNSTTDPINHDDVFMVDNSGAFVRQQDSVGQYSSLSRNSDRKQNMLTFSQKADGVNEALV